MRAVLIKIPSLVSVSMRHSVGAIDQHHECRHWQLNGTRQQLCRHTCRTVPRAATDERIERPFVTSTRFNPRKEHVSDGCLDPPHGKKSPVDLPNELLGMPGHACSRYSQRYSQEAARSLATCYYVMNRSCFIYLFIYLVS